MNKLGDNLIAFGIILIFGLLFLRDKIFGEPSNPVPAKSSIILPIVGFLLTFPISIPCLVIGFIFLRAFPTKK